MSHTHEGSLISLEQELEIYRLYPEKNVIAEHDKGRKKQTAAREAVQIIA